MKKLLLIALVLLLGVATFGEDLPSTTTYSVYNVDCIVTEIGDSTKNWSGQSATIFYNETLRSFHVLHHVFGNVYRILNDPEQLKSPGYPEYGEWAVQALNLKDEKVTILKFVMAGDDHLWWEIVTGDESIMYGIAPKN